MLAVIVTCVPGVRHSVGEGLVATVTFHAVKLAVSVVASVPMVSVVVAMLALPTDAPEPVKVQPLK